MCQNQESNINLTNMNRSRTPVKSSNMSNSISEDKLKIIIRIRPILNEEDPSEFVKLEDDNTLQIRRPGNYTYMKFNNIVSPYSSQKDVFMLVSDSISEFLCGTNVTLFAYGQTGAGKTYSMIGNYSPTQSTQNLFNFLSSKQRGVLPRALQMIMNSIGSSKAQSMKMNVSFYQIYNEKIYDLYNNNLTPLEIRESKNGEISIPDLVSVDITNMQDAIQYLMIGLRNRATGSTHANAQSSRSHSIFQIGMQKFDKNGNKITSSLRIVDLAGSQKFKMPSDLSRDQKQTRIQQLTNINSSLSVLGHCISALIQKSRTHIPFRNSKLTRILSDSLLGQGKMKFIICISPSISAQLETFSTLQFANRAKRAIFERSQSKTPLMSKKKSNGQQVLQLKNELQKQKQLRILVEKQLKQLLSQRPEAIIKENLFLKKQNEKLKQQIRILMTKQHRVHSQSQHQQKQNNLKEQMLKLPIFQKSKNRALLDSQPKNAPINRKKAEFQKKIRKFMQADSPVNSQSPVNKKIAKESEYSFQEDNRFGKKNCIDHKHNRSNSDQNSEYPQAVDPSSDRFSNEGFEDNIQGADDDEIWDMHNDTQQIIQKTCEKMKVSQFNDLKQEMLRARQQLFNLKKKDSQIQMRKSIL